MHKKGTGVGKVVPDHALLIFKLNLVKMYFAIIIIFSLSQQAKTAKHSKFNILKWPAHISNPVKGEYKVWAKLNNWQAVN